MKAITLLLLLICLVTGPAQISSATTDSAITKEIAVRKAVDEIRARKLILPAGYQAKVSGSSYAPGVGPTTSLFAVSFFGGRGSNRVQLFLVAINRSTGQVDFFSDLLALDDSAPPSLSKFRESPALTKPAVLRIATTEIQRRKLTLPAGYRTSVVKSIIHPIAGRDKHVFFVTFLKGRQRRADELYRVAVNRASGEVEFVFNLLARTME